MKGRLCALSLVWFACMPFGMPAAHLLISASFRPADCAFVNHQLPKHYPDRVCFSFINTFQSLSIIDVDVFVYLDCHVN